ncbi:serine/threonine-protein kinase [Leifsonia stereocauli]|uniref:serine/threonine-protein kinase n=1 Tax=Leifsonia stereocauli TaxID=3134136 RepID=UPI003CC7B07A
MCRARSTACSEWFVDAVRSSKVSATRGASRFPSSTTVCTRGLFPVTTTTPRTLMFASMVARVSKPAVPPGTSVNDRYVLNNKLGSDGEVYEAHEKHLNRTVALKVLRPDGGSPQSWDEARHLEQLRSNFIVPILDADVVLTSDVRYIATGLLPDGDLEADARPHGLSVALAVRFGHQIAAGVDTIHAAGMIHRDVKPANALRRGDSVLLSDVAKCILLDADGYAPRDGSWCTLAPEAAPDDGACSVSSDVYSLAATVFYLLCGEYPVDHRLSPARQQVHLSNGVLRDISDLAPHVPRAVATVVRRGMSVDPSVRQAGANAFGNALVTAMGQRRDWRRVVHSGHAYCAESPASGGRTAVGMCAVSSATGSIKMRAFHLESGRALAGVPENSVSSSRGAGALRAYFAKLG